jgi:signal transduction histidine kinase
MLVFIIGGFVFYTLLENIFYKQIDDGLLTEKNIIETEIQHDKDIPDYSARFGHEIEVTLYRHPIKESLAINDTIIIDSDTVPAEKEYYRLLTATGNKARRGYSIRILEPLTGTDAVFHSVVDVMVVIFLCLMLVSIIINFLISRNLWSPFYNTIRRLIRYDIKDLSLMQFTRTNVFEFKRLNEVLNKMSEKILKDFSNLKEFTENASHEIRTPLAIIKSKIEILIQHENLTREQIQIIQNIDEAISRLSRLNSGLLLISKIENNQFPYLEPLKPDEIIEKTIEGYGELISYKSLNVDKNFADRPTIQMNFELAEILFNNLLYNSIKHNLKNGTISVYLDNNTFSISNSGEPLSSEINPQELFNRFTKVNKQSDSLGLGLAIVKKICDFHQMPVKYLYQSGVHTIQISFNSK